MESEQRPAYRESLTTALLISSVAVAVIFLPSPCYSQDDFFDAPPLPPPSPSGDPAAYEPDDFDSPFFEPMPFGAYPPPGGENKDSLTSGYNPYTLDEGQTEGESGSPGKSPFTGGRLKSRPIKRPRPTSMAEEREIARSTSDAEFTYLRPSVGIEIAGSAAAGKSLPSVASFSEFADARAHQLSLQFEYQPKFLQAAGVFSFGGALNLHRAVGGATTSATSIYSVGAQGRYQLRYFRRQPLVPVVGYGAEYWRYRLTTGSSGSFMAQGPIVGAWILLNFFDPDSASEFYISYGMLRTYLIAEMRLLSGGDGVVDASGKAYFFGLRFEL